MKPVLCLSVLLSTPLAIQAAEPAMKVRKDVSYATPAGADPARTRLDVYAPAAGKDHPIVIYVHGGGWQRGDKKNVGVKPRAFTERGHVLVSVNYRLVPAVTYREQAGDVASATAWVRAHARELGGDPARIFLMGHSAGAHLVALVGTDGRYLEAVQMAPGMLRGVIPLDCSVYDLPLRMKDAGPVLGPRFEAAFGKDEKAWKDASPVTHIEKVRQLPPFLIVHVASRPDTKAQSHLLADTIRKAGGSAQVVAAEGKTHGTLNQDLGKPGDEPTRAVLGFLEERSRAAR